MDDSTKPSPSIQIGQVYQFLDKFRELTGDSTMPLQQVMTLLALYVNSNIAVADFPKYTGVTKSSISRNLALLGNGLNAVTSPGPQWVATEENAENRKFKYARLTPKGKALLETVAREVFKPK